MDDLPFLVVHGWWISKLLVLATASVMTAVAVRCRWLIARRRERLALTVRREATPRSASRGRVIDRWTTCLLIVFGVLGFVILRGYGRHLIDRAQARERLRSQNSISGWDPLAVASALPGTRAQALTWLEYELDGAATEAAVHQRVALAALRGACQASAELNRSGYFEQGLEQSAGCDDAGPRINALLSLGRYAEAADLMTPTNASPDLRMRALIASRRWRDAATVVDEMRAVGSSEAVERWGCLAELLRWFGGEHLPTTDGRPGHRQSGVCQLQQALMGPLEGRLDALVEIARGLTPQADQKTLDPHWTAAPLIAWMYGAIIYDHDEPALALTMRGNHLEPWLSVHARESSGTATARGWSVLRDVYAGDFPAAAHEVERATRAADAGDDRGRVLSMALELRLGTAIVATAHRDRDLPTEIRDGVGLRAGIVNDGWLAEPIVAEPSCAHEILPALTAAARGDGSALAALLEQCRPYHSAAVAVLAVAPRIRTGRERLASAVTHAFRQFVSPELPFELVHNLAWSRDVARGLGRRSEATRMQTIIDRHLAAFQDREQLVATLLWRAM